MCPDLRRHADRSGFSLERVESSDDGLDFDPPSKAIHGHAPRPPRHRRPARPARVHVAWQVEDATPLAEVLEEPPVIHLHPQVADEVARLIARAARPRE